MTLHSLARQSVSALGGVVIPAAMILISYPILLRSFGAELFGVYVFAQSATSVLFMLDAGFSTSSTYFLATSLSEDAEASPGDVAKTSQRFYVGVSVLGTAAVLALSSLLSAMISSAHVPASLARTAIVLAAAHLPFSFTILNVTALLKGCARFGVASTLLAANAVVTLGLGSAVVMFGHLGLAEFLALSLIAEIVVAGFSLTALRRIIPFYADGRARWGLAKAMARYAGALGLASVAGVVHVQLQRVLVGGFLGPAILSAFHLGVSVPARTTQATRALAEPLFPAATKSAFRRSTTEVRPVLVRFTLGMFGIALLVLIPLSVFAPKLLDIWVGAEPEIAADAASVVRIVAVGLVFAALGQPAYYVINALRRPGLNAVFALGSPLVLGAYIALRSASATQLTLNDFAIASSLALIVPAIAGLTAAVLLTRGLVGDVRGMSGAPVAGRPTRGLE